MYFKSLVKVAIGFACVSGSAVYAVEQQESQERIEPRVTSTLNNMVNYMKSSDSIKFKVFTTTEDVSSSLQKLQFSTVIEGAIQRPSKLYLERKGADSGALWFDGSEATVLDREENKYVKFSVKGGIDELMKKLDEMGVETPLAGLFRDGLTEKIKQEVFKADFYGDSFVNEIPANHLALRQDEIDWQLWTDKSTSAPLKLVITSKMLAGAPQHQVFFKELTLGAQFTDTTFKPNIPADAEEIPFASSDELSHEAW